MVNAKPYDLYDTAAGWHPVVGVAVGLRLLPSTQINTSVSCRSRRVQTTGLCRRPAVTACPTPSGDCPSYVYEMRRFQIQSGRRYTAVPQPTVGCVPQYLSGVWYVVRACEIGGCLLLAAYMKVAIKGRIEWRRR